MKKIALLLTLCFVSCGIPYDGETIVTLKLKVVNAYNQPLANEKMYVSTDFEEGGIDTSTYQKTSNNEGDFNFTMFQPIGSSNLVFEDSQEYLPVRISGIYKDNFDGLLWDIGTITLLKDHEITLFTVQLNQQTANKIVDKISVEAVKYESNYDFKTGVNPYYGSFQTVYQLKKNQNFILKYDLKNTTTQAVETIEVPLTIGSNESTFTINY